MSFNIHETQKQGNNKYKEGYYKLENPKKYIGLEKEIWYRSKYEKDAYELFDKEPDVVRWCAENEQIKIPYYCSIDNSFHHYYPDAYAEIKTKQSGKILKFVFEIKPKTKLKPPNKLPNRSTESKKRSHNRQVKEFIRIKDKEAAAIKWCTSRGYIYKFLTEDFLYK